MSFLTDASQSLKRIFLRQARTLATNQQGGVMIIAGFGISFVLLGMFALSLDHGRNYMYQANLQGKLKNFSYHLAEDYTFFRIREAVEGGGEPTSALDPLRYVLWERPDNNGNGGLTETDARKRLETRMLDLLHKDGGLAKVGTVIVTQRCSQGPANNRTMLLDFAAKMPQEDTFMRNVHTSPCTSHDTLVESGCVLVEQTVALPISCDAANNNNLPGYTDQTSQAGCEGGNKDFPVKTGVADWDFGVAAKDSKVINFVMSLDYASATTLTDLPSFGNVLKTASASINMPVSGLATTLTLGNVPVAGNGVANAWTHTGFGHTGGVFAITSKKNNEYQVAGPDPLDNSTQRYAIQHRTQPLWGSFWAQFVRRCPVDPVWTYKTVSAGECWEEQWASASNYPGACPPGNAVVLGEALCGTLPNWIGGPGTSGGYGCGDEVDWLGNPTGNKVEGADCLVKANTTVSKGEWYAACPRTALADPLEVYKNPKEFLEFKAHYSKTLEGIDETASPAGKDFYLTGDIIEGGPQLAPASGHPEAKVSNGINELGLLAKKNTDRAWLYACRGPWPALPPTGELGSPYGDAQGRPLVDSPSQADSFWATGFDCRLPDPPANSARAYTIRFKPADCNGSQLDTLCDMPEGFYRVEMTVKDLKPARAPAGDKYPPGGPFTDWISDSGGWAFNAAATASAADIGNECPVKSGGVGSRIYNTAQNAGLANANHVKYSLVDGEAVIVPELPAEVLDIASVNIERHRWEGVPTACQFDTGKGKFDASPKAGWVANVDQYGAKPGCGTYPWFCQPTVPVVEDEHPFWNINEGVLRFGGDGAFQNGTVPLGIEVNGVTYGMHKTIQGDDSPIYQPYNGGIRQLAQVEVLNVVHWDNSDYAPDNIKSSTNNTITAAADRLAQGYDAFDIFPGHADNQCALANFASTIMDNRSEFNNGSPQKGQGALVFVGDTRDASAADSTYLGDLDGPVDVKALWSAHGNGDPWPGMGYKGLGQVHLNDINTPVGGTNVQCFSNLASVASFSGRDFFILSQGAGSVAGAQQGTANNVTDKCPTPYCVMGLPAGNPAFSTRGDCAARLLNCIRKNVKGG